MATFVLLLLPETKGVSLEDMKALFQVWITDTPLTEKLHLISRRARARATRTDASKGGQDGNREKDVGSGGARN